MVFSSLVFLFLFLPLTLGFYYLCPRRWRNGAALAASLFFYAWGAPRFVFILLALSIFDYFIAFSLAPAGAATSARRRGLLAAAIALNLAGLLYFKYMNFLVDQVNRLFVALGAASSHWTRIALPIGISFFTFHSISYLVDVYRGTARPARTLPRYLLYVTLFPQLIAGPIVRYHDIADQIDHRDHTADRFLSGVWRFCLGLARKVLIANVVGSVADRVFASPDPAKLAPGAAWLGIFCYTLQIYFDFAGYSDMAIGLARMLGFELLENFNFPYIATSFTDFWRRWHISLSSFMREYLYVPLGGNRVAPWRMYLNLWIVFTLSGFWHGAAWNFVVWGAYHGLFLSLDKVRQRHGYPEPPRWLAVPMTFLLVLCGWVFFRADSLTKAVAYLGAMFGAGVGHGAMAREAVGMLRDPILLTTLAVGTIAALAPLVGCQRLLKDWPTEGCEPVALRRVGVRFAVSVLLLFACAAALVTGKFNPFIYFRF